MTQAQTMKAWRLTGHGGPECLEWREDVPVPRPGAGEVQIRVAASTVNNTDINTRIGWYARAVRGATQGGEDTGPVEAGGWDGALDFPLIQGADCCGVITAVGEGVPGTRIGERVLVRALQTVDTPTGPKTWTFGSECDGAFAEYAVARSGDALAVNSAWDDVSLAALPCAYCTAEGMLTRAGLGAERVLVTGASGGVGLAAVQLARLRGAHVTAQTSPEKAEALRAAGADSTIGRDDAPDPRAFDVVVDVVGGPGWKTLIEALADRGRYVVSGAIAGPIVELDLRDLYLRDLTFLGSTLQAPELLPRLIGMAEAERFRPVIAARYPLRALPQAQEAFGTKAHIGKIGIEVST